MWPLGHVGSRLWLQRCTVSRFHAPEPAEVGLQRLLLRREQRLRLLLLRDRRSGGQHARLALHAAHGPGPWWHGCSRISRIRFVVHSSNQIPRSFGTVFGCLAIIRVEGCLSSTLYLQSSWNPPGAGYGGGDGWDGPRDFDASQYGPGAKCIDTNKPFQVVERDKWGQH